MTQKPTSLETTGQPKKGGGCLKGCLTVLVVVILAIIGFFYFVSADLRRSDEEVLKTYQPSSEIAEIAEKNALTAKGKATLYRAKPELVDAKDFMKYCQSEARGIESLACNAPKPGGGPFGGRKMFLLKIEDPRFVDHKYAAAVHEMLHVAYSRLGPGEKKNLKDLLNQEFAKHQNDLHLLAVVDLLKEKKGEEDVLEELHSKFAVEYSNLLPELEEYYKQYFADRQKVVQLYKDGGFNSRVRKMDELAYEAKMLESKLIGLRDQLTAYQNAGDLANYNSLVPQFNNLVNQYNAKAAEAKRIYSEIEQFYQYFKPGYQPLQEKISK